MMFPLVSATPFWTLFIAMFSRTSPVLPLPGFELSGATTTAVPTLVKEESRKSVEPMFPFSTGPGSVGLVVDFLSSGNRRKPTSAFLTVMDFHVCIKLIN